jgi:hypothetical protein
MRIRNKELRQRRHRKEQRVKELIKVAQAEAKDSKVKPTRKAAKPAGDGEAKKATRAKKKTEDAPSE